MTTFEAVQIVEGLDDVEHTEEEILAAWQALVDSGDAWTLQGWYGRTATALLRSGSIFPADRNADGP